MCKYKSHHMLDDSGKFWALLQKMNVLAPNKYKIEEWAHTFGALMVYAKTFTSTRRWTLVWQRKGSLPHPVLYSWNSFTCQVKLWDDGPFPRVLVTLVDEKHLTTTNCIHSFSICLYDLGPTVPYRPNLFVTKWIAASRGPKRYWSRQCSASEEDSTQGKHRKEKAMGKR